MRQGRPTDGGTLFAWAAILGVVMMLTACGDNDTMATSPDKVAAPGQPAPIVKEWYPRPKQAQVLPDYVRMAPAMTQKSTETSVYYTVPAQQPVLMQPAQGQTQWTQQYQPPGVSTWGQASPSQPAVAPQAPSVPQYIYVPRPWGEVPPPRKSEQTPAAQPQPVPYGGWPGYGTGAGGWGSPGIVPGWGGGPYGGLPTPMLPGMVW